MSQNNIDVKLDQIYIQLRNTNELINQLGQSFETYKVGYNFWLKMILQKIFSVEELEEIEDVEKAWYQLAFNMPSKRSLSLQQLELLSKYKLIDGAQMAHLVSRLEK